MVKKSIKKNYIYNVGYQILILIAPLVTTPYISRVLGADGVGNISYVESVVAYFSLFATMGITTYGQREVSYVQESKEKRSEAFWNIKILEFITSIIALGVYIAFSMTRENKLIYLVFSLNIITIFADITWFFQGIEEFGKIVFRNTIFKILNIIYIFTFVHSKRDIVIYILGLNFFTLLSNLSLWVCLPRYVSKVRIKTIHPFENLSDVLSLFLPTIAIEVYTVLDKTMIGAITKNTFENGYYENAIKVSKIVLRLVTALGTVMIPRIGYHFRRNETKEVQRLMYKDYRFVWFLGVPLCLGLIMIAGNFVPWFFGDGYEKVVCLIQVLAFLILAVGINNVTGMQYLIPTKRQNIFTLTVVIGAVVNFVLNSILIPIYQSTGAAIASVVAETVIAVAQLVMVRKELDICEIIRQGSHYYISGGLMAALLWVVSKEVLPSAFATFMLVMTGALGYSALLLIMRDEFFISNIRNITKRFSKKKA